MPRELLEHLKKVWVSGQQLRIRRADDTEGAAFPRNKRFGAKPASTSPKPRPAKPGGKPAGKPFKRPQR
jgi:ATP-dependent RNA helicase DeaD